MRFVVIALVACSSPPRRPTPPPFADITLASGAECPAAALPDATGWCRQPSWAVRPRGTWLEVSADLKTLTPLRGDPTAAMRTATLDRVNGLYVSNTNLVPQIYDRRLRLSTRPSSCHERAYGCTQGCSSDPGSTVFEDPDPPRGCIRAAFELRGGTMISVGGQLRTYPRSEDGAITTGPTLVPSALAAIKVLDEAVLLQDRTGVLWRASWAEGQQPALENLPTRVGEILAVSTDTNPFLAITSNALVAFDRDSLAMRWQLDGEVWSQTYDFDLHRQLVLAIDRRAIPRASVHVLTEDGQLLQSKVVYEGKDLVEAHLTLGESSTCIVEITKSTAVE